MKKRSLILCGALAVGMAFGGFALMGCEEPVEPDPPKVTEAIRYSDSTTPYKDVTWQEIKGIVDWTEKAKKTDEIYYQFEGSYSEAYHEDYSRDFMLMNCYKDGGLHATFGNNNYYGYWTNVDRKGKTLVSLHVMRHNDSEYNNGVYDVICEEMSHDYYEYSSNMPIIMFGSQMRSCLISGGHYSPVKSLTVSGGQTACVQGDSFTTKGLEITVNREDGKSILIDSQWYDLDAREPNCPIKFSGFDSSQKGDTEVTLSYENTDVTAKYKCSVMGLKGITLDTKNAKKDYHVGDKLDTSGLVVNATRDDDGISQVEARRYKVYGFDGTKEGEQTLTVKYDDKDEFTAEYKVNVYGIKSMTLDAENAKKEYYVGDQVDKTGLVVTATFKDDVTVENIDVGRLEIEGFDSSAAAENQEVTVKFQGLTKTYNVNIIAPVFTGAGAEIKIVSPKLCEFKFGEKTAKLAYTAKNVGGKNIYTMAKPTDVDMGITDTEFDALHKQYILDRADFSASKVTVYEITWGNYSDNDARRDTEVTTNPADAPGGYTEQRFILLNEDKGEATLTYKYWYAGTTDTFVMKYTVENGVLTYTELVSGRSSCGITFAKLHKTWRLNADFTASKVV